MSQISNWQSMRSQLNPADSPKTSAITVLRVLNVKQPPIRIETMILLLGIQTRRTPRPG